MQTYTIQTFMVDTAGKQKDIAYFNTADLVLETAQIKAKSIAYDLAVDGVRILRGDEELWRWSALPKPNDPE